jgi:hypothetical protein
VVLLALKQLALLPAVGTVQCTIHVTPELHKNIVEHVTLHGFSTVNDSS